jgi:DNA-binding SARP family transcriptional activator
VEFRILGPLEVLDGGRQIPLGGAKPRSLLALLLLARGRPVATERLIEEIWDGRRPDTAHKIVQLHVSSLRKALGEERISTLERGYMLHVQQGELDVERFEELADAASGAPPARRCSSCARHSSWCVAGRSRTYDLSHGWARRSRSSRS